MKTIVISLEKIISTSEELERAFFNWLRENNISYTMSDFISDNIIVEKCDVPKIKKIWPEVINL